MAITAAEVLQDIKFLLNDPLGTSYTDAKLIPFINKAYKELQAKMRKAGMQTTKEVSAVIPVPEGTTLIGDGSGLPNDFISPISVSVRDGASQKWLELKESPFESLDSPSSRITGWAYRNDELKFKAATTVQEILLKYNKSLQLIDASNDPILIVGSELFLAARAAALAALLIGSNPSRADALNDDSETMWTDFKSTGVKRLQYVPSRRRVNRYRR